MLKETIGIRIRALLSGSQNGVPEWTPLIEAGNDYGLFKPTDAPWIVHADVATMIGGIRALLLQAMHPGSLAGVMQHSRYEEDALGRLAGTIRWLTICSFGSVEAVETESARVRGMHDRVRGKYLENSGETRNYQAADQDLLRWVHLAFTDSFLATHQQFGKYSIPGGADAYVGLWGKSVIPLGVENPPKNENELRQQIAAYDNALRVDERTLRVVSFLRKPPLPAPARVVYALLFAAAVNTLPEIKRNQLHLKVWPRWFAFPLGSAALKTLRFILGTNSPLEAAALSRHKRLNAGN
ncbi:MAG: hypothetical protein RL410_602 [Actinomycetota bacterium]|jgi:uncharacterized protein (DUF2236 family)